MPGLDQASLQRFEDEGYLIVEGLLDIEQDIQPVIDEYTVLMDNLMQRWYEQGKIPSAYEGLPLVQRLTRGLEAGEAYVQHLDISLPTKGVTNETPMHLGPAVFRLLRSPRLLNAVESIIGPEIFCHPFHHTRIKVPERSVPMDKRNGLTSTTPWHQDQAALLPEADESRILTLWFPINEATVENGCLMVLPKSHGKGLEEHCMNQEWGVHIPKSQIPEPEVVTLPMRPGDVLFLQHQTKHASLPNLSDDIRWSLDLRYSPIGHPTGRPIFPGFVARSKEHPEDELHDPEAWADLWRATRARLAAETESRPANRWFPNGAVCEL